MSAEARATLPSRIAAMLSLLQTRGNAWDGEPCCPLCRTIATRTPEGEHPHHAPDCALAALIREAAEEISQP